MTGYCSEIYFPGKGVRYIDVANNYDSLKNDNDIAPIRLMIDPEPAEVVRLIFSLTLEGLGQIAITKELAARKIVAPSVYKHRQGDTRFSGYGQ